MKKRKGKFFLCQLLFSINIVSFYGMAVILHKNLRIAVFAEIHIRQENICAFYRRKLYYVFLNRYRSNIVIKAKNYSSLL